jgi:nitrate reductase NapE component
MNNDMTKSEWITFFKVIFGWLAVVSVLSYAIGFVLNVLRIH